MLLTIILTAAIFQGSIISSEGNGDVDCDKNPFRACNLQTDGKFPESAEDVDDLCKDLVPFHHCISEFIRECNMDEDVIQYKGIFDSGAILTICNKESQMYQVVVENVKCLKNTYVDLHEPILCKSHLAALEEETPDILQQIQNLATGDTDEAKRQLQICLETVFEVGCMATGFSKKCGPDAAHLFLYIVDKSRMVKNDCTEEHQPVIQELSELMKFELKK